MEQQTATLAYQLSFPDVAAGFMSALAMSWLIREPLVARALAVLLALVLLYGSYVYEGGLATFADEVIIARISEHLRTGHWLGAFSASAAVHLIQTLSGSRRPRRKR
ncbi:MAG: hypothetical protein KDA53_00800 [Hyphomonas sp.]|nr:hypothetical protein [Hyphomonas sp.]